MKNKGFTLIEIIVVVTIISLLATIGIGSYSTVTKMSADSRRKADMEEVRSGLEMYRANNGAYPASITAGNKLTDGTNTYIQKIPKDPKDNTITYNYSGVSTTTYILGAYLENVDSGFGTCGGQNSCGSGKTCNYCLTPYGRQ